jgi:hypothetical protein
VTKNDTQEVLLITADASGMDTSNDVAHKWRRRVQSAPKNNE